MTLLEAIALGALQGITEFFPVSSSAHLEIAKRLLSLPPEHNLLYFDLLCHMGTLFSLLWFFQKDLWQTLRNPKELSLYALALLPLFPAYFLLKPLLISWSHFSLLPYTLACTGTLLWVTSSRAPLPISPGGLPLPLEKGSPPKWKDVLCIGLAQTLALIPGLSRSGWTIAVARWLGWSWTQGARFSFLLALPTILGGTLLESVKLFKHPEIGMDFSLGCCIAALLTSFLVGLLSVRRVFVLYTHNRVRPVAIYCLVAAIAARLLNG